jgi:hypothetical protein
VTGPDFVFSYSMKRRMAFTLTAVCTTQPQRGASGQMDTVRMQQ